jgi:hypothetical protein
MTQDEIIDMAREAGFFVKDNDAYSPSVQEDHELTPFLVAFANLVAAKAVANLDRIPLYTKDTFLQLIKELRPAIKPLEGMGKGKTTDEWFDILVKDIKEKL